MILKAPQVFFLELCFQRRAMIQFAPMDAIRFASLSGSPADAGAGEASVMTPTGSCSPAHARVATVAVRKIGAWPVENWVSSVAQAPTGAALLVSVRSMTRRVDSTSNATGQLVLSADMAFPAPPLTLPENRPRPRRT